MKHYAFLFIFFSFGFGSCGQQEKKLTSTEEINFVFKKYTDAIKAGQGQEAIKYISKQALNYYDTLIQHTLYSDETELSSVNILSRMAILRMRHTQSLTFWDTMTAKKLLEQMWSRPETNTSDSKVELTNCEIDNYKATCILELNGSPTEMKSFFNKENDEWKIDITSINENGIQEMKNDMQSRNLSETDYFILTLQELENKQISKKDLYTPLKKK